MYFEDAWFNLQTIETFERSYNKAFPCSVGNFLLYTVICFGSYEIRESVIVKNSTEISQIK